MSEKREAENSDDEWIGPSIADAAPKKKQKGRLNINLKRLNASIIVILII